MQSPGHSGWLTLRRHLQVAVSVLLGRETPSSSQSPHAAPWAVSSTQVTDTLSSGCSSVTWQLYPTSAPSSGAGQPDVRDRLALYLLGSSVSKTRVSGAPEMQTQREWKVSHEGAGPDVP